MNFALIWLVAAATLLACAQAGQNDTDQRIHQIVHAESSEDDPSVIEIVTDMFDRITTYDIPYVLLRQYGIVPSAGNALFHHRGGNKLGATIKGPQSLSILMNFGHDGMTSVHLADYQQIYWSDSGYCTHGQMFDPLIGVCRDLFCTEGHILLAQGCAPDPNYDKNQATPGGMKLAQEMNIEMYLDNKFCDLVSNYNISSPCPLGQLLFERPDLKQGLADLLAAIFAVNSTRLANLNLYSSKIVNRQIDTAADTTQEVVELNTDNHFVIDFDRLRQQSLAQRDKRRSLGVREITQITDEQKDTMFQKIERIRVGFTIKAKANETSDFEPETISLYYRLVAFAFSKPLISLMGQLVSFSDVIEIKNSTNAGWCSAEGEEKSFLIDGFRILASYARSESVKTRQYFIYVTATKRVYTTGFFYLGIWYDNVEDGGLAYRHNYHEDVENRFLDLVSLNGTINMSMDELTFNVTYENEQLLLSDVTDLILGKNSTKIKVSMVNLVICDKPRIRSPCFNHTTIRLRKCELDYSKSNRTYCWPVVNKCFSLDEYEIDSEEPMSFIRICQFVKNTKDNTLQSIIANIHQEYKKDDTFTVPGWVSFISIVISLTCMIASLVTYFLFSELRNIPGWNIINLTLALFLAQTSFMVGSLVNSLPAFCFTAALMTHYGFLAAFFWMNVIAFDLFRNFREKSSHVLLKTVTTRDRLLKYALFAWLAPLVIVAIPLIIDLSVSAPPKQVPMRPCYASFLKGCSDQGFVSIRDSRAAIAERATLLVPKVQSQMLRSNGSDDHSATCQQRPQGFMTYYLSKSCWIQSGRATLVFFGVPVGIIIVVNAIFYFISICNIRKQKNKQKKNDMRRYSRAKLPGDEDVKFYMQMAIIMGFTWITGFFMSSLSDDEYQVLNYILIYTFILSNASTGVFIFCAFILCKPKVKLLYKRFYYKNVHEILVKLGIRRLDENEEKPSLKPEGLPMPRRNGIIRFSAVSESSTTSLDTMSAPPPYSSSSSFASKATTTTTKTPTCLPSLASQSNLISFRKHFIKILPSVSQMTDDNVSSSCPRLMSVTSTQSPDPLLTPNSPFAGQFHSRVALNARFGQQDDLRCSTSSTSSSLNDEVFLKPPTIEPRTKPKEDSEITEI